MIWQRYFFKEVLKTWALCFLGCCFVFVMVDYSTHAKNFSSGDLPFTGIALYYVWQIAKYCDILVPLALMISTIKVLSTAQMRSEILALCAGGIGRKRILAPFLGAATLFALLLLVNAHTLLPHAQTHLTRFESKHLHSKREEVPVHVHAIHLTDGSLLLYQRFDPITGLFHDVYWIQEALLTRLRTLDPNPPVPTGEYVHTLRYTKGRRLVLEQEERSAHFPGMHFDPKALFTATHPPQWQTPWQLIQQLSWKSVRGVLSDHEAQVLAALLYKLTMPWVCFFVVLLPAFFTLPFRRDMRPFALSAWSLCGLFVFFATLRAALILGQSQTLPPLWALGALPLALIGICLRRFVRL